MRRIERREWWLWATAIVIMLLLTLPVISFTRLELENRLQLNLGEPSNGLIGLVFLFCLYIVYSQRTLRQLQRENIAELLRSKQLEAKAEEYYELSVVDPLTGLYNRRFAESRIREECSRAERGGTSLTAVMLDLDEFKEINDRYGHTAGDLALKEFARKLKACSRGSDVAVRLGGDEFLLILTACDQGQVPGLIDRLRPVNVELPTGPVPVLFSAGWSVYQSGVSPDQLIEQADRALYSAKNSGT